MENHSVYYFAVGANLCFALGSQVFAKYSRSISPVWMNCFKAIIGGIAFAITVMLTTGWHNISFHYISIFLASGIVGLGIGDMCILSAFSRMGPGRTLMLFAFQPIVMGVLGFLIFGQTVDFEKLSAIVFFIICLGIFSFESFKKSGTWQLKALGLALAGMSLDGIGLILSRYAFDSNPEVTPVEGNFYRCIGGIALFFLISRIKPFHFFDRFKAQKRKDKVYIILGCITGTYIALTLYLSAVKTGHLATISGIAITGTIFASLFECIIERKMPSKYLAIAFVFFFGGMYILLH